MGGAKKKSLAQMEKAQVQTDKKPEAPAKKAKGKTVAERKARGIDMPDIEDQKFLTELSKMGAITPFALANQFNIRMSIAKDLLEELERKRLVSVVGGNTRIRIYRMAAA